ncbi:MAG TPA: L-histidine N(alpha)-methyltransferase [Bryobacteraceae bacterium]|nr:L-histidine N(alpha)-methyltransferase [Bryobacteraceae bacterium]
MLTNAIAAGPATAFAADVRAGLAGRRQKELPSKYLYDAVGSKLFEVIGELPEYGLTRADQRLLRSYAQEIVQRIPGDVILCELGSGNGSKTRWILEALSRRRHTYYFPIEISPSALRTCERELADIESVGIVGLEREYLGGLLEVAARRNLGQRILVLFLGSTIGNFSHPADLNFLREVRLTLQHGDCLLLGSDLEKPIPQLLEAYDDPLGVTAAFNLNLLARINRELDGDFLLSQFEHLVRFNSGTGSVEMHLRSKKTQTVEIRQALLSVHFEEGETIWTENSRKYSPQEIVRMAEGAGFACMAQWIDREWPFAESLLMAI